MRFEGENFNHAMILRGTLERLSPVLMTALVTAFALAPLLFEAERPGTEILHPVAAWRIGRSNALFPPFYLGDLGNRPVSRGSDRCLCGRRRPNECR